VRGEGSKRSWIPAGLAVLALPGCSGGGSAPNQPPSFTSPAVAVMPETGSLDYQAVATDPDGDPLTYSIQGGADGSRFAITAGGALRFVSAPDFERPADSGGNNVYEVQLGVSDGRGGSAALVVQVTIVDAIDEAYTREIGNGFVNPVAASSHPTLERLYIAEPGSIVQLATDGSGAKEVVIGTPGAAALSDGSGIIDFAVGVVRPIPIGNASSPPSPIAVVMRRQANGVIRIDYYEFGPGGETWHFARVIAEAVPPPGASPQDLGGSVRIENERVYAAFNDARAEDLAQDPASPWGKIRCGIPANYFRLPSDQPISVYDCSGNPRSGPELLATGLRQPFGVWGDRGQIWQELNLRPSALANFGWPYRDGTSLRRSGEPDGLHDPALQYRTGDGDGEGRGIVPGYVYNGPLAAFREHYFFGDISGKIWSVPVSALMQGQTVEADAFVRRDGQLNVVGGTIDRLVAFARDSAGALYIVDGADGQVFRIDAR
jgi:hypothetical protein